MFRTVVSEVLSFVGIPVYQGIPVYMGAVVSNWWSKDFQVLIFSFEFKSEEKMKRLIVIAWNLLSSSHPLFTLFFFIHESYLPHVGIY